MKYFNSILIFILFPIGLILAQENQSSESIGIGDKAVLFSLRDQYDNEFHLEDYREKQVILIIGDRHSRAQMREWGMAIKESYGQQITYIYIINMPAVPNFLRNWIKGQFRGKNEETGAKRGSVYIDWGGIVFNSFKTKNATTSLVLINHGLVDSIIQGALTPVNKDNLFSIIDSLIPTRTNVFE